MKIKLDENAVMPTRAHEFDAGMDLYCKTDKEYIVPARGNCVIDTGAHIAIPNGYVGFIKSKSGLNIKHNIVAEGVIDAGYTGSIVVKLYNHGDIDYTFQPGNKITQLVILPILHSFQLEQVESLDETERGNNGFGSSGK